MLLLDHRQILTVRFPKTITATDTTLFTQNDTSAHVLPTVDVVLTARGTIVAATNSTTKGALHLLQQRGAKIKEPCGAG